MAIYSKLSKIQYRLIAPKGQVNEFGKYPYRSCEDIIKALKPLCDEENCMVYMTNDLVQVGDRNYVKATVTFVDLETNETITSTAHAREEETKKGMDGSQITGASSSYARKYALAGLFMIDNEKDSDATNDTKKESKPAGKRVDTPEEANNIFPNPNCITTDQKLDIYKELNRTGADSSAVLEYYKIKEWDELPRTEYERVINKLRSMADAKKE